MFYIGAVRDEQGYPRWERSPIVVIHRRERRNEALTAHDIPGVDITKGLHRDKLAGNAASRNPRQVSLALCPVVVIEEVFLAQAVPQACAFSLEYRYKSLFGNGSIWCIFR